MGELEGSLRNSITITLSGEVKGKGRPRFARATGRAYTPEPTRTYESSLRLAAQGAMIGRPPMTGPLGINVVANLPVPKSWSQKKRAAALDGSIHPEVKPDFDNIMKMLDAFNLIVWNDDKQVVRAEMVKRYSLYPGLSVTVRRI